MLPRTEILRVADEYLAALNPQGEPTGKRRPFIERQGQIKMDVTTAEIEITGDITGGSILFVAPNAEPLLGAAALDSSGFQVAPRTRTLMKLLATRLTTDHCASAVENPPQRFRPPSRPGRGLHPLCALLQSVGCRPRRTPRSAGPGRARRGNGGR